MLKVCGNFFFGKKSAVNIYSYKGRLYILIIKINKKHGFYFKFVFI